MSLVDLCHVGASSVGTNGSTARSAALLTNDLICVAVARIEGLLVKASMVAGTARQRLAALEALSMCMTQMFVRLVCAGALQTPCADGARSGGACARTRLRALLVRKDLLRTVRLDDNSVRVCLLDHFVSQGLRRFDAARADESRYVFISAASCVVQVILARAPPPLAHALIFWKPTSGPSQPLSRLQQGTRCQHECRSAGSEPAGDIGCTCSLWALHVWASLRNVDAAANSVYGGQFCGLYTAESLVRHIEGAVSTCDLLLDNSEAGDELVLSCAGSEDGESGPGCDVRVAHDPGCAWAVRMLQTIMAPCLCSDDDCGGHPTVPQTVARHFLDSNAVRDVLTEVMQRDQASPPTCDVDIGEAISLAEVLLDNTIDVLLSASATLSSDVPPQQQQRASAASRLCHLAREALLFLLFHDGNSEEAHATRIALRPSSPLHSGASCCFLFLQNLQGGETHGASGRGKPLLDVVLSSNLARVGVTRHAFPRLMRAAGLEASDLRPIDIDATKDREESLRWFAFVHRHHQPPDVAAATESVAPSSTLWDTRSEISSGSGSAAPRKIRLSLAPHPSVTAAGAALPGPAGGEGVGWMSRDFVSASDTFVSALLRERDDLLHAVKGAPSVVKRATLTMCCPLFLKRLLAYISSPACNPSPHSEAFHAVADVISVTVLAYVVPLVTVTAVRGCDASYSGVTLMVPPSSCIYKLIKFTDGHWVRTHGVPCLFPVLCHCRDKLEAANQTVAELLALVSTLLKWVSDEFS